MRHWRRIRWCKRIPFTAPSDKFRSTDSRGCHFERVLEAKNPGWRRKRAFGSGILRGALNGRIHLTAGYVFQHLRRMLARDDRVVRPRYFSLFVNQIADAAGPRRRRIVASSIRDADRPRRVTQQRERIAELLREGRIVRDGINTRTNDLDVVLLEFAD